MNTHFVIGDTHGNWRLLLGLLTSAGLIDADGNRTSDVKIVHIGDLTNNVAKSVDDDITCLEMVDALIDIYILGNHEAPALGMGGFGGYAPNPHITTLLNRYDRMGKLVPSHYVGNTLLTHAGVGKSYCPTPCGAEGFHNFLMYFWQNRQRDKEIFTDCTWNYGRFGHTEFGGILWCDWQEKKTKHFNQIVGHTPMETPQRKDFSNGNWVQHIDVGGKKGKQLYGVFINENGEVTEGVLHNE